MKLRVYKNTWPINLGILGFLNILNKAGVKNQVIIKEDYIEFDSLLLKNFHNYYLDYFIEKDDMSRYICRNIEFKLSSIKSKPDKTKDIVKKLKEDIQYQNNKVKKYFKEDGETISNCLNQLKNIKSEEDFDKLQELMNICKSIFNKDYVREKLTLNKSRSYIGGDFFGQASFLQKSRSALDKNNQANFIYRDYLSSIIEYGKLNDLIENGDLENLNEYIDEKVECKDISSTIISILKKIKRILKKENNILAIKEYLSSDNLDTCDMCSDHKGIVSVYTEGNFGPLAVSADNALNMYWNQEKNYHICDICKFILFCTPAGAIYTKKNYLENEDNEFYSFVNIDASLDELYNTNINLNKLKDKENPFNDLVMDIVSENRVKSKWQLDNILFVEFKANLDSKKCKMNYFNMPSYLAEFFVRETNSIAGIYNQKFKANIIDNLFKNKDLKHIIDKALRANIKGNLEENFKVKILPSDILKAIKIRRLIHFYKKGVYKMNDKKLQVIKFSGHEIHDYYVNSNSKNKINGIAYKLLNSVKVGNKKDFMDTVLRLFMSAEKSVPSIFIEIMAEKDLDFESIGHAFITGLISEKYEAKNNDSNNEEVK